MIFENTIFLYMLPFIVLPVLLYFFSRIRRKRVNFSAAFLFKDKLIKRSRIIKIKELILMLIRILAVSALIFLLARPSEYTTIYPETSIPDNRPENSLYYIVLDNSYSMDYTDTESLLEKSKHFITEEILNNIAPGSQIGIFLCSTVDPAETEFTTDIDSIITRIAAAEIDYSSRDFSRRLYLALDQVKQSKRDFKYVFFVSDFQERDWKQIFFESGNQHQNISTLNNEIAELYENSTMVFYAPISHENIRNLMITDVDYPKRFVYTGNPIEISVDFKISGNLAGETGSSVRVLDKLCAESCITKEECTIECSEDEDCSEIVDEQCVRQCMENDKCIIGSQGIVISNEEEPGDNLISTQQISIIPSYNGYRPITATAGYFSDNASFLLNDAYSYDNHTTFPVLSLQSINVAIFGRNLSRTVMNMIESSVAIEDYREHNLVRIAKNPDTLSGYDFIIIAELSSLTERDIEFIKSHINEYKPALFILNPGEQIQEIISALNQINVFRDIRFTIGTKGSYTFDLNSSLDRKSDFCRILSGQVRKGTIENYVNINASAQNYLSILDIVPKTGSNRRLSPLLMKRLYEQNIYLMSSGLEYHADSIIFKQVFPLIIDSVLNRGIYDAHTKEINIESGYFYPDYVISQNELDCFDKDMLKSFNWNGKAMIIEELNQDINSNLSIDNIFPGKIAPPEEPYEEETRKSRNIFMMLIIFGLIFFGADIFLSVWASTSVKIKE